jgi:hypothetical protein
MSRPTVFDIKMYWAAGLAVHFNNISTADRTAIIQYPACRNSFQYFVVNFTPRLAFSSTNRIN